jgi:hypothetical protein
MAPETIEVIAKALEKAGVEFIAENGRCWRQNEEAKALLSFMVARLGASTPRGIQAKDYFTLSGCMATVGYDQDCLPFPGIPAHRAFSKSPV